MNYEILELSDVAEVFNGKTPSKAEQRSSGFPVLKIRDVDNAGTFVGRFTSFVEPAVAAKYPTKQVKGGDTLILNAAHNADYVGSKSFFAVPRVQGALATGEWLVIRPDDKAADAKYVFYWSQNVKTKQRVRDAVKGIHLYPKDVAAFPIQLPSVPEQKRIAALLENADRLRRTRRYARQLSDTFLQSVFLEMFGERFEQDRSKTRLGELVRITGGGTPARNVPAYFTGKIPWLTAKDMQGDYIFDTQEHITEEAIAHSATNLVPAGSILVVVKSKVLMHRLPLAISKLPLCHGQDIKSIQCLGSLAPEFTRFALKYYEPHLLRIARGANTEGLTLPMLNELLVPDVSKEEQGKFVAIVSRFERLRAQQREAERQAQHLFQALLHRAFNTQLKL